MNHSVSDIINIFNQCFQDTYQTILVRGGEEPLYIPAKKNFPYHQVIFARGFFSSALHEIAHWLIAGSERRQLEDYGYWYIPDGRDKQQQKAFEQVEVKPQALEWILSDACQYPFQISSDNLNGPETDMLCFLEAILKEKQKILNRGLSHRAYQIKKALQEFYGIHH